MMAGWMSAWEGTLVLSCPAVGSSVLLADPPRPCMHAPPRPLSSPWPRLSRPGCRSPTGVGRPWEPHRWRADSQRRQLAGLPAQATEAPRPDTLGSLQGALEGICPQREPELQSSCGSSLPRLSAASAFQQAGRAGAAFRDATLSPGSFVHWPARVAPHMCRGCGSKRAPCPPSDAVGGGGVICRCRLTQGLWAQSSALRCPRHLA